MQPAGVRTASPQRKRRDKRCPANQKRSGKCPKKKESRPFQGTLSPWEAYAAAVVSLFQAFEGAGVRSAFIALPMSMSRRKVDNFSPPPKAFSSLAARTCSNQRTAAVDLVLPIYDRRCRCPLAVRRQTPQGAYARASPSPTPRGNDVARRVTVPVLPSACGCFRRN